MVNWMSTLMFRFGMVNWMSTLMYRFGMVNWMSTLMFRFGMVNWMSTLMYRFGMVNWMSTLMFNTSIKCYLCNFSVIYSKHCMCLENRSWIGGVFKCLQNFRSQKYTSQNKYSYIRLSALTWIILDKNTSELLDCCIDVRHMFLQSIPLFN